MISLYYEKAAADRTILLVGIFVFYLSWGVFRLYAGNYFWLFYIDGLLLVFLDYQSRFIVNYFFHSLFFLLIVEAGFVLKRREINKTGLPIIMAALSKFLYFLTFDLNARTLSETIFHLLALLFVLLLFQYLLLQKEEKQKNKLLYQELLQTHKQLKHAMKKAEEVSLLEERNRIARDMHDSVGHELTGLIMLLEATAVSLENTKDISTVLTSLNKAHEVAKRCLAETRNAVHCIQENTKGGITALLHLIDSVGQREGISIDVRMPEQTVELNEEQSYTLYRVIQEAITNALKHGSKKELSISLTSDRQCLHFVVKNQIEGDSHWIEGFGINTMKDRLKKINGTLTISSNGEEFVLCGSIDIKGANEND